MFKLSLALSALLLFSAILLPGVIHAQEMGWEHTWGGSGYEEAYGVAVDREGNIYMVGSTNSFGGDVDAFIAKFNEKGVLLWDRIWDYTISDSAYEVAVDNQGNVYMVGWSSDPAILCAFVVKFSPSGDLLWDRFYCEGTIGKARGESVVVDGAGNVYLVGLTGDTPYDVFIAKFDSDGNLLWDRTWGGANSEYAYDIALDSSGNLYIVGHTNSFGLPDFHVFIAKFSSAGSLLWDRIWQAGDMSSGEAVTIDPEDNIYVGLSANIAGDWEAAIAKFDSDGNLLWDRTWGGDDEDDGYSITLDSVGGIYLAGYTTSFPIGDENGFIAKFDSFGNLLWDMVWGETIDSEWINDITFRNYRLYAVGLTTAPTHRITDPDARVTDPSASVTDPNVTPGDPDVTPTDPDAEVEDPSARIDQPEDYEASILQLQLLAPVGGEVHAVTNVETINYTLLLYAATVIILIASTALIYGKKKSKSTH